jgi:transposase
MEHVGVDLGGRQSQVCVRAADGKILLEKKIPTSSLKCFFQHRPKSRIVLETCSEAFRVADWALECGHEVRVVPATLVRSLGVGARGIKTDRRDAQVLSEVSCRIDLPSVHIPAERARDRRTMCAMREQLLGARTALVNAVQGWKRTQLLKMRSGEPTTLPQRIREAALARPDGLPQYVERLLQAVEALNVHIKEADKELETLAKKDPVCQRLTSVPGIGPATSMRFVAALDDRARFPSAHSVEAFLGLTPGENSSSDRQRRTSITKAGPSMVRTNLVQAAWTLRRTRPNDPMSKWAEQIEQRRGKFIATVALARKLAGVLFALWRDGTRYEPNHRKARQVAA